MLYGKILVHAWKSPFATDQKQQRSLSPQCHWWQQCPQWSHPTYTQLLGFGRKNYTPGSLPHVLFTAAPQPSTYSYASSACHCLTVTGIKSRNAGPKTTGSLTYAAVPSVHGLLHHKVCAPAGTPEVLYSFSASCSLFLIGMEALGSC